MTDDAEIVLCCLLRARDGVTADLTAYDDLVLGLVPAHGGEARQRAAGDGDDGQPHEVHLIRFPDQVSLDAYLADPARVALAGRRDRAVSRTELFPVTLR